jgi:hypothetical protein
MSSRIQNWDNSYKPEAIKVKLDARRPGMETDLTAVFADQEAVVERVRAILNSTSGTSSPTSLQAPFYQAAANQMIHIRNNWRGGGIFDKEMSAIITKWSGRGLASTVLNRIATEIFAWTPPGP